MKLGIYGGSFDPVHLGHLLVAQAAIEELGLDRLFFVPAAQSPFKSENEIAPATVRLQLLRLALAAKTNCEIDGQEIRRGGISFAVETVRELRGKISGGETVLPHRRGQHFPIDRLARSERIGQACGVCRHSASGRTGGGISETISRKIVERLSAGNFLVTNPRPCQSRAAG